MYLSNLESSLSSLSGGKDGPKLSPALTLQISSISKESTKSGSGGGGGLDFQSIRQDSHSLGNKFNAVHAFHNRTSILFEILVHMGYAYFLIPFKWRREREEENLSRCLTLHENKVQKVVSGVLCAVASLFLLLVTIRQFSARAIDNNPVIIFKLWSYPVYCAWAVLFVQLFWRSQHKLTALLNDNPRSVVHDVPDTKVVAFAVGYFGLATIIELIHEDLYFLFPTRYDVVEAVERTAGRTLHALFLRESSVRIPYGELSPTILLLSFLYFLGWQIFGVIKAVTYVFVTFSSIFLISKVEEASEILKRQPTPTQAWELFEKVDETATALNDLCALPVFGIYSNLIPLLSSGFVDKWDSEYAEYKILILLQFAWPLIALICAAQATTKGEELLNQMKEIHEASEGEKDEDGDKWAARYFLLENTHFGIRGARFFRVSYGFLGTTLSIILTYAIVVLQFLYHPDPICNKMRTTLTDKP